MSQFDSDQSGSVISVSAVDWTPMKRSYGTAAASAAAPAAAASVAARGRGRPRSIHRTSTVKRSGAT